MTKEFDTLVLIGRFEPVTSAHVAILQQAVSRAKELIIIVGSANQPRTFKNPWKYQERVSMLNNVLNTMNTQNCRVSIDPMVDTIYNNQAWAGRVQAVVAKRRLMHGSCGIIGHKKDESSFYLDMFPQWETVDVGLIQPLNASNVRELYFKENCNLNFVRGVVPDSTFRLLEGWKDTPDFKQIVAEREFVVNFKKTYAGLPYAPTFNTADACVIQSGHVLMIKRRAEPGRGLWALPGGYLDAGKDTSLKAAMVRELREETGLKVPAPVILGSIQAEKTFDAIDRSPRGRIITQCFKVVLPDGELSKVKGNMNGATPEESEVLKVKWVPIGEIDPEKCFEDHYEIIQWAIGT